MNATFWLTAVSVVIHGILAGISFDVAAVKLPTRRRIGVIAYAAFARGNDLGNGLVIYRAAGILALGTAFGTIAWAYFARFAEGGHDSAARRLHRDHRPLRLHCDGGAHHAEPQERAGRRESAGRKTRQVRLVARVQGDIPVSHLRRPDMGLG